MDLSTCCNVELRFPLGADGGIQTAAAMVGLRWQLQCFGTVVSVEPLEDSEGGLLVRYADSWAAAAAREAFAAYGSGEGWEEAAVAGAYAGEAACVGEDGEGIQESMQGWEYNAEGLEEADALKPYAATGYWGWDAASTEASLTPLNEQDSITSLLSYLSASASGSSDDLQSLGESEASTPADAAASEPMTLTPLSKPASAGSTAEEERAQFPTASGQDSPTASPTSSADVSLSSGPKFVRGLELSHLNWGKLAKGQEWRNDLMLRGLPQRFCVRENMEALLKANGLRELVTEIRVTPGERSFKTGSATLFATSSEATSKLAKFFHGAQLPGSRTPVAVGFAPGRAAQGCGSLEPMRVPSGGKASRRGLPLGVCPPPGLSC